MPRISHHRTSGRDLAHHGLLGLPGLLADAIDPAPDAGLSLRPFATLALPDVPVEAASATPPDPDRLLARARDAMASQRLPEAEALFRELLELAPAHRDGSADFADLLERRGDVPGALEVLGRALRQRPDDPVLLLRRAAINRRRQELGDAESDVRQVLRGDARHPDAMMELGLVLLRRGRAGEAADILRRHAAQRPDLAAAWFHVAEALNQASSLPDALEALRRAVDLDDHDARVYHLMGRVLDRMGRPDEAMPMYRRGRELART
ncbi:MAG: tetratricopeptide repeat protein [Gemmatimonadales bacterium]|jgi:tetratricopeptide (TPR) repeat protein|nr:tetratricopeptide repeat protein [Gemmatimonadales bacterium]